MRNALLLALVLTSLSSLVACGNSQNNTYEQQDPQQVASDAKTQACISGLRSQGVIGADQEVYIYTDNTRIQDVRRTYPAAYVMTISELRVQCQKSGYPVQSATSDDEGSVLE